MSRIAAQYLDIISRLQKRLENDLTLSEEDRDEIESDIASLTRRLEEEARGTQD